TLTIPVADLRTTTETIPKELPIFTMEQETEISNSETSNLEEIDIDNMTLKQLKEYAQKVIEKRKKDKQKNKEIIRELIRKEISSSSSESGSDENPKIKPKIKGIVKPLEFETPSHKSRKIEEEFYETPFKSTHLISYFSGSFSERQREKWN